MAFLIIIGIVVGSIYFWKRYKHPVEKYKLSSDKSINEFSYQSPIPYNLKKHTAEEEYLNVEVVDIDPQETKVSSPSDSEAKAKEQSKKEFLEPDSILVNADTGEINIASEQFDTSEFVSDNEIEPIVSHKQIDSHTQEVDRKEECRDESPKNDWKQKNAAAIKDLF